MVRGVTLVLIKAECAIQTRGPSRSPLHASNGSL
jgi:hypothetical protein